MSKELEALNRLCFHLDYDETDYCHNGSSEADTELVERAVKALAILKDTLYFRFNDSSKSVSIMSYPDQECDYTILFCETQEEYEIVKAGLSDDD